MKTDKLSLKDWGRFSGARWNLPRCFIIHAHSAADIKKVVRQVKSALSENFHVDADMDYAAAHAAPGSALAAIADASLVVCILDELPPNVVFELGYAKALGKPCIRMLREGATASIFKYFLRDGQPQEAQGEDQPIFDFDKHFIDPQDIILRQYSPADGDAPGKLLAEELAKPGSDGKTLAQQVIEVWLEVMRQKLGPSVHIQPLLAFVASKAKKIEIGKPLLGPLAGGKFSSLLKQAFLRGPTTAREKQVARKSNELPDAAVEAMSDLPPEERLTLVRKYLKQKRHAQDQRLMFVECRTVLELAEAADFKENSTNKEAERLCDRFLRKCPESSDIHTSLGTLRGRLKQGEAAEKSFQEALRINPNAAEAHAQYAAWLREANRNDEAEQHCNEALRLEPDHVQAHCTYARVLEQGNRHDEALEYYRGALRSSPYDANVHYDYATLLRKLQRLEEAQEHYLEALRFNPDHGRAHFGYAVMLEEQGKLDDSEKHFRTALRANPDDPEIYRRFAAFLVGQERHREADQQWQKALNADPNYALAHYDYALFLTRRGRPAKAETHYREALRLNPTNAEAHNDYAILLMDQKQAAKAEKHFQEAARLRTASAEPKAEPPPAPETQEMSLDNLFLNFRPPQAASQPQVAAGAEAQNNEQ